MVFYNLFHIVFMADDHQMFFLIKNIFCTGKNLSVFPSFGADNTDSVGCPEVDLFNGFSYPLRQGKDLIDGISVLQVDIVENPVGAKAHRKFFRNIPVRENHFVGAVF